MFKERYLQFRPIKIHSYSSLQILYFNGNNYDTSADPNIK